MEILRYRESMPANRLYSMVQVAGRFVNRLQKIRPDFGAGNSRCAAESSVAALSRNRSRNEKRGREFPTSREKEPPFGE